MHIQSTIRRVRPEYAEAIRSAIGDPRTGLAIEDGLLAEADASGLSAGLAGRNVGTLKLGGHAPDLHLFGDLEEIVPAPVGKLAIDAAKGMILEDVSEGNKPLVSACFFALTTPGLVAKVCDAEMPVAQRHVAGVKLLAGSVIAATQVVPYLRPYTDAAKCVGVFCEIAGQVYLASSEMTNGPAGGSAGASAAG